MNCLICKNAMGDEARLIYNGFIVGHPEWVGIVCGVCADQYFIMLGVAHERYLDQGRDYWITLDKPRIVEGTYLHICDRCNRDFSKSAKPREKYWFNIEDKALYCSDCLPVLMYPENSLYKIQVMKNEIKIVEVDATYDVHNLRLTEIICKSLI